MVGGDFRKVGVDEMTSKFTIGAVFAALWLACGAQANAGQVSFTGQDLSPGGIDSAKVLFDLTGSALTITLTNTTQVASNDQAVPTNVLTGLGFNTQGATFFPLNAGAVTIPGSTTMEFGPTTHVPGDGWMYKTGIDYHGYNAGISASGLNVFGPDGNLGPNPVTLNGIDYGLAPKTYTQYNGGFTHGPLYKNSLEFHFSVSDTFTLAQLKFDGVVFQFGTSLTEPFFPGVPDANPNVTVPEPSSLALLGLGGIGLAVKSVRRRRQQAA